MSSQTTQGTRSVPPIDRNNLFIDLISRIDVTQETITPLENNFFNGTEFNNNTNNFSIEEKLLPAARKLDINEYVLYKSKIRSDVLVEVIRCHHGYPGVYSGNLSNFHKDVHTSKN
ncbi:hypothetical protein C1645_743155 [Glomus cerebriforme]|uniref:Uncharacterized protein n=1 Tax=Glomus cerebriforme TaxID=658196 RepID=A0A397SH62_9GLOM|nr:hypothetical protein C1645_743155 [Glomus cerebriforme]